MNQLKSILAATDFSADSLAALKFAVALSRPGGISLSVAHIVEPAPNSGGTPPPALPEEAASRLQQRLATAMDEAGAAAGSWTPILSCGHPFLSLARLTLDTKPDLLVLGARGLGNQDRENGPAGSVAAKATRKLPCRVLLVPAAFSGTIRRVVAAVDFSHVTPEVLRQACRLARRESAVLEILHVLYPPNRDYYFGDVAAATDLDADDDSARVETVRAALRRQLDGLGEEAAGLDIRMHFPYSAHPGHCLVKELSGARDTLLVLGTRGRSDFEGFFTGTTAERVIAECPCPVLAIKPPGFRSPLA